MKLLDIGTDREIKILLKESGMVSEAIATKVSLFKRSGEALIQTGADKDSDACLVYVPGRIEVLGKHTDYAGGKSLVMAADKGICLVAIPNNGNNIHIIVVDNDREVMIDLSTMPDPVSGDWSNYPITVIRRLMANFTDSVHGCTIAFGSDLPIASGMSSSSALIIAIFMAIAKISNLQNHPAFMKNIHNMNDLAEYAATIENGLNFRELAGEKGVGTFGGSEDHTAILNCRASMISEFSYCPIKFHQNISISDEYVFVVAASGVKAKKTGNAMDKYNRVSLMISELKSLWQNKYHTNERSLNDIFENDKDAKYKMIQVIRESENSKFSEEDLIDRLYHFISENYDVIPTAVEALMKNDYHAFGEDVNVSQKAAEELLKNQVPETKFLCRSAQKDGAVAASAFGAGFGGSVWALIKNDKPDIFIEKWLKDYREAFPEAAKNAGFFICRTGPAAFYLDDFAIYNALNVKQ